MSKVLRRLRHGLRDTTGAVMVEFAVVCLVFCTVVAGIIDLGLAFYVRQVVTNASREGARYGVVYQTDASGNRITPNNITQPRGSIQNDVLNYYLSSTYLPTGSNPTVSVAGSGYTTGTMGSNVNVTVSATYNWIMLGRFIPSLGSSTTISATTVMQCE
jgi:Flp pilus assembly protein TadG